MAVFRAVTRHGLIVLAGACVLFAVSEAFDRAQDALRHQLDAVQQQYQQQQQQQRQRQHQHQQHERNGSRGGVNDGFSVDSGRCEHEDHQHNDDDDDDDDGGGGGGGVNGPVVGGETMAALHVRLQQLHDDIVGTDGQRHEVCSALCDRFFPHHGEVSAGAGSSLKED